MPIISNFPSGSFSNDFVIPEGLPELGRAGGLNAYTWEEIAAVSAANLGDMYWSIGDTKSIALNGTIGTLSVDTTLNVYIIGFNHNRFIEGNGITFGTFKDKDGVDICLVNNLFSYSIDGTKTFNMNHWGNYNYGGWAGCDLRYDILGSTDQAPSGYGEAVTEGRTGYDASSTTATNPVPNTLMAALPAELRAVMKPITKFSDNTGGGKNTSAIITTAVDYLPLLAEFEIFGRGVYSNYYEFRALQQYEYYRIGNSRVKYYHDAPDTSAYWWERSPYYAAAHIFCFVASSGNAATYSAGSSLGLAPAFKV